MAKLWDGAAGTLRNRGRGGRASARIRAVCAERGTGCWGAQSCGALEQGEVFWAVAT